MKQTPYSCVHMKKMKEALEYNELVKSEGFQEVAEASQNTKSDWICFQYMKTYSLIEPGARTASYGYLSIFADLRPDENLFPEAKIPLLHVIYSTGEEGAYEDCASYKWSWGPDDPDQCSVAFGKLQLYANKDDIEDEWWNYGWSFSMPLNCFTKRRRC